MIMMMMIMIMIMMMMVGRAAQYGQALISTEKLNTRL